MHMTKNLTPTQLTEIEIINAIALSVNRLSDTFFSDHDSTDLSAVADVYSVVVQIILNDISAQFIDYESYFLQEIINSYYSSEINHIVTNAKPFDPTRSAKGLH